jgi:transcriptional regulator with XRE-family HTH domain
MKVQELLHFRGKTQSALADALGFSQGYFSEVCSGKKPLLLSKVLPLAELIGAPVEDVVRAFEKVRQQHE